MFSKFLYIYIALLLLRNSMRVSFHDGFNIAALCLQKDEKDSLGNHG